MPATPARRIAAEVLLRVAQGGAFANLTLDAALRQAGALEPSAPALDGGALDALARRGRDRKAVRREPSAGAGDSAGEARAAARAGARGAGGVPAAAGTVFAGCAAARPGHAAGAGHRRPRAGPL